MWTTSSNTSCDKSPARSHEEVSTMTFLNKRGQQIGEYAVLLGIVLGGVVAVQAVIRTQIAKGINARASEYYTQATSGLDPVLLVSPDQTSASTSASRMDMTNVDDGTAEQKSKSATFND